MPQTQKVIEALSPERPAMTPSPNPLIQGNAADTLSATRDYVADIASSFSMDDQVERGRWLRVMVVLHALDAVMTENLYHR
jgi:hypothetical protein